MASSRLRRGDSAVPYGLLWALSCLLLVTLRFCSRRPIVATAQNSVKSQIYDDRNFISKADLSSKATLSLVESLPVGDFELSSTVLQTCEVLMHHIEAATTSINLSAMYWNLLGEEDRKTFSALEMSTFGADRGTQLLFALQNAASRGVKIRILTGPQQGGGTTSLPREVQLLVDGAPEYVTARCWSGPSGMAAVFCTRKCGFLTLAIFMWEAQIWTGNCWLR